MSAGDTFDPTLLKLMYTNELIRRMKFPDWTTPEWRAWADEWREEVPLTNEQVQENAAWRKRVAMARTRLAEIQAATAASLNAVETDFGVKVFSTTGEGDDGEYEVDDYDPPHRPTYRTKDGAPPEPRHWKSAKFVTFNRAVDAKDLE